MFNHIDEPEEHTHVRKTMKVLIDALASCSDSPDDTVLTALALVTNNLLKGSEGRDLEDYISQLRLANRIA